MDVDDTNDERRGPRQPQRLPTGSLIRMRTVYSRPMRPTSSPDAPCYAIETQVGAAIASSVAAVATMVMVVRVVWASSRGFDGTDEGLYLALASAPRSYPGISPGAFHLWAPLFSLVGRNVTNLRIAKLGILIVSNVGLGWSISRWLQRRNTIGGLDDARVWLFPAAASAAGFMAYSWTPQSPGYNEAAAVAWTVAVACAVMLVDRPAERAWLRPVAPAIGLGVALATGLVAKWSAGLPLAGLAITAMVLTSCTLVDLARRTCWLAASFTAAVIAAHLSLLDVPAFLRGTAHVSRLLSRESYSPRVLLRRYVASLTSAEADVLHWFLVPTVLMVAGTVVGSVLSGRRRWWLTSSAAKWLPVVATVPLALSARTRLWGRGGSSSLRFVTATMFVVILVGCAIGLTSMMRSPAVRLMTSRLATPHLTSTFLDWARSTGVVYGLLLALPLGAAFGTDNPIASLTVLGASAWMCVLVLVLVRSQPIGDGFGYAGCVLVIGTALLMCRSGAAGLVEHPYRVLTPLDSQNTLVSDGPLRGLRLDEPTARFWSDLTNAIRDASHSATPRIVGLFRMPGAVFVSDGRAVGAPWYSPPNTLLTSALIGDDCRARPGRIVVLRSDDSPLDPRIEVAISTCGVPYPAGFETTAVIDDPLIKAPVRVMAPRSDANG
jgi:hypothetical protein